MVLVCLTRSFYGKGACHEDVWGSGDITALILNLGTT